MKNKFINICLILLFSTILGYLFFVLKGNDNLCSIFYLAMSVSLLLLLTSDYLYSGHDEKKGKIYILIYFVLWSFVSVGRVLSTHDMLNISLEVFIFAHVLASIFMLIQCGMIISSNFSLINKYQLILDIVCISIFFYYVKNIFFSIISKSVNIPTSSPMFLMMVSDIVVIMILLIVMCIFRMESTYDAFIFNVFTFLLMYMLDFVGLYMVGLDIGIYRIWIDFFVALPFFIFGISIVFFRDKKIARIYKLHDGFFINMGSSTFITLLFLMLILARLLVYNSNHEDLLIIFLTNIVYLMLSLNYQKNILERALRAAHEKESEHLQNSLYDRNITLEKMNQELIKTVRSDNLTGLYSRSYLIEVLEGYDVTYSNKKDVIIFVLDILKFKSINELASHSVGDSVLVEIANKLRKMFHDNKIFRTDSNEFAILIEDRVYTDEVLKKISKDITTHLSKPIFIDDYVLNIDIVVGCDKYTRNNIFIDIFNNASYSCKQAKKNYIVGGENFQLYDDDMSKKVKRAAKIEALLNSMNYDEEFIMYYQPQFSVDGTTLIGIESLLRWRSKDFNEMISPAEFIPIAEASNLIIKIVQWTIEKAIKQIKTWNEQYNTNLKMAVNISPKYLSKKNFLDEIKYQLKNKNINPEWLDCEITEMSVMSTGERIVNIFEALHDMGVSISVDDFGTGYSSLSYLKNFKVDKIKIAKELVDTIATDDNEYMIVRAIVMMAEGLKIKTIAEGVEEIDQRDKLQDLGCSQIQGYLYGRPENAEIFEEKYIKTMNN